MVGADLVLFVGEEDVVGRIVAQVSGGQSVRASGKIVRSVDFGSRKRVLRKVRVRRKIEKIRGEGNECEPEVERRGGEADALARIDRLL